jgi:hypothetical protein
MKKVIATLALVALSVPAFAHGGYHGGYYHHRHGWGWGGWVAPVIVGGVVGYELARPPVVVQQPPVVVQQPPVVYTQPTVTNQPVNCGPWTETRNTDGTTTISRICQ